MSLSGPPSKSTGDKVTINGYLDYLCSREGEMCKWSATLIFGRELIIKMSFTRNGYRPWIVWEMLMESMERVSGRKMEIKRWILVAVVGWHLSFYLIIVAVDR